MPKQQAHVFNYCYGAEATTQDGQQGSRALREREHTAQLSESETLSRSGRKTSSETGFATSLCRRPGRSASPGA